MRKQQIILIYAIIGYYLAQSTQSSTDECTTKFIKKIQDKCEAFSKCTFTNDYPNCKNTDCSIGNGNEDVCSRIIHKDFPRKECKYTSADKCEEVEVKCSDIYFINGRSLTKEDCSQLKPDINDDKHYCGFDYGKCSTFYKECQHVTDRNKCNNNIPYKSSLEYCQLNSDDTCGKIDKNCENAIYDINKDDCNKLKPTDSSHQKCVYNNYQCSKQYILCSSYNNGDCEDRHPLITNGNDFDYRYNCIDGSDGKCKANLVECDKYTGPDDSICSELKVKDSSLNKCIYYPHSILDDATGNIITFKCKEVYKTCKDYNDNEIEKNRLDCEIIKPPNSNEECVYIPEKDICEKRVIYSNCDKYEGSDKKICESIISPNTNSYCVLEKDSKCKERPLLCHEAFNINDCLYVAKASDNNKKCSFGITSTSNGVNVCYEEYIKCEDYLENNTVGGCGSITLYDGKKCIYESNRCLTKDKECKDATTKEECELIAQTGVSDPDKKICQYIEINSGVYQCKENYKYCSDYRGDKQTICENIKPYNETGNNIDITSKCEYESDVGCQRVPKECSDGNDNPILCALISPNIKDNKLKYCAYIGRQCIEHFKTCDAWKLPSDIDCAHTIPENYLTNVCEMKDGNCVQKKDCTSFTIADQRILCSQINYNCKYESGTCVTEEKKCGDIKFYTLNDGNEEICKSIEASKIYKSCVLKEDLSGCEEKYNNSIYENININTDTETEGSSSRFITIGIQLIIVIFFLLI